jgi:transposase
MPRTRKTYPPSLKARVAVEAIRGQKTTAAIAQGFSVPPNLVSTWKRQALEGLPEIFQHSCNGHSSTDLEQQQLYEQIGRLKVELDFLKKRAGLAG